MCAETVLAEEKTLSADAEAFFRRFMALRGAAADVPLPQQRARARQFWLKEGERAPAVASRVAAALEGPHGTVALRIYVPAADEALPLLCFLHRGGWVYGGLDESEAFCCRLAQACRCAVAAIEYPLAPEARYPVALEQCYAAIQWLCRHAAEVGCTAQRMGMAGESAGATMAAALSLMTRDRGLAPFAYQLLFYPMLDSVVVLERYADSPDKYLITPENIEWFWRQYLADPAQGREGYAAPFYAAEVAGLPATLLVTGSYDPLHHEACAFGARLRTAQVPTDHYHFAGALHGFLDLPIQKELARQAIQQIGGWVRRQHGGVAQR